VHLAAEELEWLLVSQTQSLRLTWARLGLVEWSGAEATFPAAPREPGVYLVRVALGDESRIYIGQTANLRSRLRSYGGNAAEQPNEPGSTTANMHGRIRRTYRAGGSAAVWTLKPPIERLPEREPLDPAIERCRIMLERLAISTAYLHGERLINERGFPEYPPGHPLQ
jgi:hypothetical protein